MTDKIARRKLGRPRREASTPVDDVISDLGGNAAVARLLNSRRSTVSMWCTRGRIAPAHYLKISQALAAMGKTADPSLFGIKPPRLREEFTYFFMPRFMQVR